MKVKFHKISNNHTRIRSEVIEGKTTAWPTVGKQFFLTAEPFENPKAAMRWLQTNVIREIIYNETGLVIFKTESGSIYAVEALELDATAALEAGARVTSHGQGGGGGKS